MLGYYKNVIACCQENPSSRERVINQSSSLFEVLPMPHFPKPVCHSSCIQVLNYRKVGLIMS